MRQRHADCKAVVECLRRDVATADPDAGAAFLRWNDARTDNPRTDAAVVSNATVTALFESTASVPIDWYAEHGFAPGAGEDWSDVDARDPFGKGMTLSEEYVAMTDPTNPVSFFELGEVRLGSPTTVDFSPNSTGRVYTLQYRSDLIGGAWSNIPGQVAVPGGGPLEDSGTLTQRFYRVLVGMPE